MSYTITSDCIGCHRCLVVCPTNAITIEENRYQIDSHLCNGCVGYYSTPQCVAVCPTNNGCIPNQQDYWKQWFFNYDRLVSRLQNPQQTYYWEQWFESYSQGVSKLLQN